MDTEEKKYNFSDYLIVTAGFVLFCILQVVGAKYFLNCTWEPLWTIYIPIIFGFIIVAIFSGLYDVISENIKKNSKRKKKKLKR